MNDLIQQIGNSVIQHGKYNDRIYLLKYDSADIDTILSEFDRLIKQNDYSKIFIKVDENSEPTFLKEGFRREALIPNFYENSGCAFLGKFLTQKREDLSEEDRTTIDDILKTAESKAGRLIKPQLPQDYKVRILTAGDVEDLAGLYRKVFDSYPFPIFDPKYLLETMESHVVYFGCFAEGKLIAASSSEMDKGTKSVEMTDFATLPEYRGQNLSLILLAEMEPEMRRRQIKTFFTIARSMSYGMNITFSKSGYRYGGTLVNNTNISGRIESMNVWYKPAEAA
ncbi:MAG: putative beta-lysine N-acetyltransferase [Chitinispirillaceae bacterium]